MGDLSHLGETIELVTLTCTVVKGTKRTATDENAFLFKTSTVHTTNMR